MTMQSAPPGELAISLLAALLFGAAIGFQREMAHRPAGLRTHILVAVGACAFAIVSRLTGDSRIAAGIVTGIGFLGAGAIVRTGITPHGLTTAASIWSAAAIGTATGIGGYHALGVAAAVAIAALAVLSFSDQLLQRMFRWPEMLTLHIETTGGAEQLASLTERVRAIAPDAKLDGSLTFERDDSKLHAQYRVDSAEPGIAEKLVAASATWPDVVRVATRNRSEAPAHPD